MDFLIIYCGGHNWVDYLRDRKLRQVEIVQAKLDISACKLGTILSAFIPILKV